MARKINTINSDKCGWRPTEWGDDVGLGRAQVYEMMREGLIKSVKVGGARIITTPPREYLASLDEDRKL